MISKNKKTEFRITLSEFSLFADLNRKGLMPLSIRGCFATSVKNMGLMPLSIRGCFATFVSSGKDAVYVKQYQ
jgi:hypothetical protein